ncbi:hypothetical protein [Marinicella litoralis]|uniref:DUF1574 domain-containing protein n=2 Tax=Marinicella litoralis TaxID=644220 RepID=A0A4V3DIZ0_9GAMM|nr:hypothetical protein [Marinicella litoralis]TDR23771.1 hypothetical protein C8D91_0637 [Marinicella litoralis]
MVTEMFLREYVVTIPKSVPKRIHSVYASDNPNVAIGDSHIYRSFIDQHKYLNLGRGGSTIPVMDLFIRNYFKYRTPNQVIVEASPQLVSEIHLEWHDKNHNNFFNINQWFVPKIYFFEKGIAQQLASINSWKSLKQALTRDWPNEMDKSSYWVNLDEEERLKRTLSRVDFQEPMMGTEAADNYFSIYRNMLEFLLEKGADVCVLRTPVDESYLQYISDREPYQASLQQFKQIAETLNIKYVDFRELAMDFDLAAFINQDHLMPTKSKEFSALVDQACYQ